MRGLILGALALAGAALAAEPAAADGWSAAYTGTVVATYADGHAVKVFIEPGHTFTSPLNQPGDYNPVTQVVDVNTLQGISTVAGSPSVVQALHADKIAGYTVGNARITWRSADRSWSAALEVTNFTDKRYYLTLFDLAEGSLPGYVNGQPGVGRQWAVTVRKTF